MDAEVAVKPKEYTQTELSAMTRDALEEIALGLNIPGHLMKNKTSIEQAILAEQGNAPEGQLNAKQLLFCELYATDREFFGNGTQAYIEAYDVNMSRPGAYASAQASASRLLSNVMVLDHITKIMEVSDLNDAAVDKHMAFWIAQKASPMAALAAIKEYNKLRKRTEDAKMPSTLIQNNYSISIHDDRGKEISAKVTDYIMEITKAPQPVQQGETA